jgi:hypothetical protein
MEFARVREEAPAERETAAREAPAPLLALRAAAGNRAFARLVQRSPQTEALHKVGVDDTWLADKLAAGRLGTTAGGRDLELHYFPGKTGRRALVIGGVHGTERQGVQVARLLERDLATSPADFSVLVIPVMFPDNAAAGKFGTREFSTPTNRNFPTPDKDLAASKGKDAQGRDILPENQLLMEVMERFKPERIISCHGTWDSGKAGVFYDPRKLTAAEQQQVELEAAASASASSRPRPSSDEGSSEAIFQQLYKGSVERGKAAKLAAVDAADLDLSLRAAKQIDAATAGITGRDARDLSGSATTKAQGDARKLHGSVAGNIGTSGNMDTGHWGGDVPGGVSLGGYASARGISIFTVEPPVNRNIADYDTGGNTAGDKITKADREKELQAYADAVRTVLLAE